MKKQACSNNARNNNTRRETNKQEKCASLWLKLGTRFHTLGPYFP
jgi:hypothetical protein